MSQHDTERLRDSSLPDLAAQYGFRGRRFGKRVTGRCVLPGHPDKTPSFSIRIHKNDFKCFGCGQHGDVFDFVGLMEGISGFHGQAVRLEQITGIPPVEDNRTPAERSADQRAAEAANALSREISDWDLGRAMEAERRKAHLVGLLHWALRNRLETGTAYFEGELASIQPPVLSPDLAEPRALAAEYQLAIATDPDGTARLRDCGRDNRENSELVTAGIVQLLAIHQHMHSAVEGSVV